jgi:nitronate monooxygenase
LGDTALIHPNAKARVVAASGDGTIRTSVYGIARQRAWPGGYTRRLLKNEFIKKWHGLEEELKAYGLTNWQRLRGRRALVTTM